MHAHPLHEPDYALMIGMLRDLRRERGVTQAQLAEALGVNQSLVSKVERRERRIDAAELRRICIALGLSLADFALRFEALLSARRGAGATSRDQHRGIATTPASSGSGPEHARASSDPRSHASPHSLDGDWPQ